MYLTPVCVSSGRIHLVQGKHRERDSRETVKPGAGQSLGGALNESLPCVMTFCVVPVREAVGVFDLIDRERGREREVDK